MVNLQTTEQWDLMNESSSLNTKSFAFMPIWFHLIFARVDACDNSEIFDDYLDLLKFCDCAICRKTKAAQKED